ncbi:MAG: PQQ-dependent sugar dehydrogenase, partial [Opitutaceae bacterium]
MRHSLRTSTLSLLAGFALCSPASAQTIRTGTVAQRYTELCANCHGKNLEGGSAPTMLKDEWLHGGDDDSIAQSIRNGFPEKGMPPWGVAIPEKEIRAMVVYIHEMRAKYLRENTTFPKPAESITVKSQLHAYQLNTWVAGVKEPWSLAFLSADRAVMTEKRGFVYLIEKGKLAERPLIGVPLVDTGGQAGLYDVVPHPDYEKNGWVYFSYSDPQT